MQNLLATARNIRHCIVDGENGKELVPEIEAVLTTMGRHSRFVGTGLVAADETETIRFSLSPKSAREFAKALNEWADDAEKESEILSIEETQSETD